MKKCLSIFLMVVCCACLYAAPAEKVETLSAKVILANTNGYFVLSDSSCWKVIGFAKRWRSLSEWWSDVQLVPESYECVPNDWFLGTEIAIYAKFGNLGVDVANASNQEQLKQCTNLLVNTRTGQILFAIGMSTAECIVQLYDEANSDGYTKGYEQGKSAGYDEGHAGGYRDATEDALRDALRGAGPRY